MVPKLEFLKSARLRNVRRFRMPIIISSNPDAIFFILSFDPNVSMEAIIDNHMVQLAKCFHVYHSPCLLDKTSRDTSSKPKRKRVVLRGKMLLLMNLLTKLNHAHMRLSEKILSKNDRW